MKQASVSSTDQGGGKRRGGACGSGSYFQTATAKLIYCLCTRLGFILSVYGDLRRQVAELITDVPAVIGA